MGPDARISRLGGWGSTAFAVGTSVVTGDCATLAVLFDPAGDVRGRINLLRDLNDFINMAESYPGIPRCSEDPEKMRRVQELLETQKDWVKPCDSETMELLVSGEVAVLVRWNGYAIRARDELPSNAFVYPGKDYTGWMDKAAVSVGASNRENAKTLVNFIRAPENTAMITNHARSSSGIMGSEAFVDPALVAAPEITLPAGVPAPDFTPTCSAKATALIDRVWT